MTDQHFENLWEQCEQLHQSNGGMDTTIELLMQELLLKINLYQAIDTKTELLDEDRARTKSRILGEILLTLTHLSLKDNINVFEALTTALYYRSIIHFSQKYYSTE
jgi:hypothetical protein